MSNRSMLEFNHDYVPDTEAEKKEWLEMLLNYMASGSKSDLPYGVTFFYSRHHTDPCPLGNPPNGWQNDR